MSATGKSVHEVLVNRLGGLSLPRKSVVRLTDRPDIILDVYRGRKTTTQQQQQLNISRTRLFMPVSVYQKYVVLYIIGLECSIVLTLNKTGSRTE